MLMQIYLPKTSKCACMLNNPVAEYRENISDWPEASIEEKAGFVFQTIADVWSILLMVLVFPVMGHAVTAADPLPVLLGYTIFASAFSVFILVQDAAVDWYFGI